MPDRDLTHAHIRSRIEGWLLDASADSVHRSVGDRKAEAIGAMSGTVVEIGPGTGVNMRYYGDDVHVIGIEPNPDMHPRLHRHADEHGVDLEIRTIKGERLDVGDGEADGVVGTLVLCGVDDPGAVLAEIRRVLRPGGVFFFLEHVAAPDGTWTRRLQRLVKRPHRWMFQGCEVDRDTESLLRGAGFSGIDLTPLDGGPAAAYVRHQIVGTAVA